MFKMHFFFTLIWFVHWKLEWNILKYLSSFTSTGWNIYITLKICLKYKISWYNNSKKWIKKYSKCIFYFGERKGRVESVVILWWKEIKKKKRRKWDWLERESKIRKSKDKIKIEKLMIWHLFHREWKRDNWEREKLTDFLEVLVYGLLLKTFYRKIIK